jgi:prephenate dehydratase
MKRVGIPGELGSYSEEAARASLGSTIEVVCLRDNHAVTRALANNDVDLAVLPVENSLAGSVVATYDAILAEPEVCAIDQVVLPIHHCIVGITGATLDQLRTIDSHPVALAQCRAFFLNNPSVQGRTSHDTASAARQVAESADPTRAAIASARAAERYGLAILARNVEDRDDNRTRFLVLSAAAGSPPPSALVQTMLAYETSNEPGALVRTLAPLAARQMNMVKIESRPAETPWSFRFVVEFEHTGGIGVARAVIEELAPHTSQLRHIGTFLSDRECRVLGDRRVP